MSVVGELCGESSVSGAGVGFHVSECGGGGGGGGEVRLRRGC